MKTAPTMLNFRRGRSLARDGSLPALAACLSLALCACTGTQHDRSLTPPRVLVAPYDSIRGETLWAVAPLRNESGTTLIDGFEITDKVILAVEEVRGLRCLPLNRVLETMRSLELSSVRTPEDSRRLATALGVDGLIVGSVTAYDPYNPPRIGLMLALHASPGSMLASSDVDPRSLNVQATDTSAGLAARSRSPVSVVSALLDGSNHQVLMDVKTYAQGRHDDRSALGWEIYLASMDRYAQFAAHHVVDRLVQNEWLRLTNEAASQAQAPH